MSVQLSNTPNSQNETQNDWELSKENFQPLKAGRKCGGLKDNTTELRKQLVEEQRRAFWEEISAYSGDDPLEAWLRFIKWTQDTFQAGGHKAELLPLLERCTRELQHLPKYQNDIRYLRVWVQYADCLPDPGDVFCFLKENSIGLDHALYYIAFATYLEFRGNYAKADSVYQQGINRLATPVDRLKGKFQEFQHRMARRIQRKTQEQQAGSCEPEHPARQSLGTIAARRPARGGLLGPAGMKRKAAGTPPREADNENGGGTGLSVFVDDEFTGNAVPSQSAPAATFLPGRTAAGPWSKLGSFEQGRKENAQRATVWAGQKLKQKPVKSAPPAPKLEVFADPEFEQETNSTGSSKVQPSLRQRLEKGSQDSHLDEYLANDPLRLYREHSQEASQAAGGISSGLGLKSRQPHDPDPKRRKEEVLVSCEDVLSANGEDMSFEELRARAWKTKAPEKHLLKSTKYNSQDAAQPAKEGIGALSSTIVEQKGSYQPAPMLPSVIDKPEAVEPRQLQVPKITKSTANLVEPTMTIATRDAFAAINNMFKGSLPAEFTGMPPNPYTEPTMHGYEPTMTLATRNAFVAINNMFQGSTRNEFGTLPPRAGLAEPTITINTKAAFDAINSMFGNKTSKGDEHFTGGINIREDTQFLAPAAKQEAGCGFSIREDTQFLAPAAKQETGGGFSIREDTQFLAPAAKQEAGGGFSIREDTQFLAPAAKQEAGGGFSIREDTQFLAPAAKQEAGGGFSIREGTQFLPPAAKQEAGGGFSIREDTQFLPPAAKQEAGGGFSIREDTEQNAPRHKGLRAHISETSPAAAQVSKWGFVPEDDLQSTLSAARALDKLPDFDHAQTAQLPTGLTTQMHELCISQDDGKENSAAPQGVPRNIHKDEHATAALQPLRTSPSSTRTTANALLSDQGVVQQDSFDVTSDEVAEQGPLTVDPFDTRFHASMLDSLEPPVLQWPGVTGCSLEEEEAARQALKLISKSKSPVDISVGGQAYTIEGFVGAGSYATVYRASNADGNTVALKLELPPCPWEWYICQALHSRISDQQRHAFIDPLSLIMGPNASFMVLPFLSRGSVQDLVNNFRRKGQCPDELVAMHFAMEMLKLLDGLCSSKIMHCDIKPDNLLIHVQHGEAGDDENAAPLVQLQLIDFGRSVDLELLPPNTLLQGDSGTDAFRCVEMREGDPWLYQADCYGVCGVLHCLLFGDYMQVDRVRDSAGNILLRLRNGWKRYWARELWEALFSTLLNHTDSTTPPPAAALLRQFELHLDRNRATAQRLNKELRNLVAMCQC